MFRFALTASEPDRQKIIEERGGEAMMLPDPMNPDEPRPDFFQHGTRWVRADLHLHTRADKREWEEDGDDTTFTAA